MIDRTHASRTQERPSRPQKRIECDCKLISFHNFHKALMREELDQEVGDVLTKTDIKALAARRDVVVDFFRDRIKQKGASSTLFDLFLNSG